MSKKNASPGVQFPGFPKNIKGKFFRYPIILENYWCTLEGSEQKVLDYILRQTYGWNKKSDKISLSQFAKGNGKNTKGAGISETQAVAALKALEEKGYITVERKARKTNIIHLKFSDSVEESPRCRDEIKKLIMQFEPVAGHLVEDYLESEREISALEDLVTYHGYDKVMSCISILKESNEEQYMPTIVSPRDLRAKMPNLLSAIATMQMEHDRFWQVDTGTTKGKFDFSRINELL